MKLLIHLCFLILLPFSLLQSEELYPRLRPENALESPSNFRKMSDPYLNECQIPRDGLDHNISASGQFSEKSLQYFVAQNPTKKIIIVDLRREYHGFVNGSAVSWKLVKPINGQNYEYNKELTSVEIEEGENKLLQNLLSDQTEDFKTDNGVIKFFPNEVSTERQLVEKMGLEYVRLPILDHHYPSDQEVDQIIALIQSTPKDTTLHFHCAGGEGRTTTVLSMIDMILNPYLSPNEIMERQEAIGGSNLYDPDTYYADHPEKIPAAKDRLAFLKRFHQYCIENPHFSISWSSWILN